MLEQVMRERAPRLLAYAAMVTGNDAEAHDVLQDALVKCFSKRRGFDHVNAAEAYVRRAIPTVYIDGLRRRRTRDNADLRSSQPDHRATDLDSQIDVQRALADLPPRVRACMVLRFYDDLTVAQIAHTLGLAEGTVKRYLSDGSAALALALGMPDAGFSSSETIPVISNSKEGRRSAR
jgi:RNA polymerase sigma factor (sigma-70 family)